MEVCLTAALLFMVGDAILWIIKLELFSNYTRQAKSYLFLVFITKIILFSPVLANVFMPLSM